MPTSAGFPAVSFSGAASGRPKAGVPARTTTTLRDFNRKAIYLIVVCTLAGKHSLWPVCAADYRRCIIQWTCLQDKQKWLASTRLLYGGTIR
jgi:hypothetical protein